MIERCYNPKHPYYYAYGGRGIGVSREWREDVNAFCSFVLSNIGERPASYSLDRIDNNLGYAPGNVRWASAKTQNENRAIPASSYVRAVLVDNNYISLSEAARLFGVTRQTIVNRIARGELEERPERVLTIP